MQNGWFHAVWSLGIYLPCFLLLERGRTLHTSCSHLTSHSILHNRLDSFSLGNGSPAGNYFFCLSLYNCIELTHPHSLFTPRAFEFTKSCSKQQLQAQFSFLILMFFSPLVNWFSVLALNSFEKWQLPVVPETVSTNWIRGIPFTVWKSFRSLQKH